MITEKDIQRINELYHKYKDGTITPKEQEERIALRIAYIAAIRENLRGSIESITIQEADGSLTNIKERHDMKYPGGTN